MHVVTVIASIQMPSQDNSSLIDMTSCLSQFFHNNNKWETAFLFQCISALVQRYNSVLLHDSFVREDYSE